MTKNIPAKLPRPRNPPRSPASGPAARLAGLLDAGIALSRQGRLPEAEAAFRQALALAPLSAQAHCNLGAALSAQGRFLEAEASCRRALKILPGLAQAHNNLGVALREQRRLDEAAECYRQAVALQPDSADAHNNLANILKLRGRFDEAAASYRTALALRPDFAYAHCNLAATLHSSGQYGAAVQHARLALAAQPDFPQALDQLGQSLKAQGKLGEAVECYRLALARNPGYANAWHNLLLAMAYADSVPPAEMADAARQFGQRLADPLRRQRPFANQPDPNRKLRLGYVSDDLRAHPVSYFTEALFQTHDRSQFELHAYAGPHCTDAVSARLRRHVDQWHEVGHDSDEQLADRIEADRIDILVDLSGHTAGNRLLALARKPAPVQVTWLGYPASTGMAAMDYRISDPHAEPAGMAEHHNVETLWCLPEVFCCFRPPEHGPEVASQAPLQANGFPTFGCFNNFAKVTDAVIALWAKVLAASPGARLMLEIEGIAEPGFRAEVEGRFARCGVGVGRLQLVPREPANQYVLYNRIDIALDPFPCNGGTTTFDTLWMGVPLVTLAGRHFVSRMGVSLLTNAGLPQLVAASEEDYVAIASGLANDPARLLQLRHGLRQRVAASPLMDAPRFTRHLEQAYRAMWQRFLSGQARAPQAETGPGAEQTAHLANLLQGGRLAEAEAMARTLTQRFPQHGIGWKALCAALKMAGRHEEALRAAQQAAALGPHDAEAHKNLGVAYQGLGRPAEAAASFQRALEIDPGFAEAHNNLANAHIVLRQFEEAVASCRAALALRPDFAYAECNLAVALHGMGQYEAAIGHARQALALQPALLQAYDQLGQSLKAQGRLDEAIGCYRAALARDPVNATTWHNLLLTMTYAESVTPAALADSARAFGQRVADPLQRRRPFANLPGAKRRLKVGYVSDDLRDHPVSYFTEALFESHDRSQFELHAYAGPRCTDAVSARLRRHFDHWHALGHEIGHASDEGLADQIEADRIDILVDLAGHTGGNRLLAFARKPAPVQVTWLGYPAGTGMGAMDYRLTDALADPPGMTEAHSAETLWRLPEVYCCFHAPEPSPEPPAHPPRQDAGFPTFGCFNNFSKVSDAVVAVWARVLRATPDSRLLLKSRELEEGPARTRALERFAAHGIEPQRLTLEGPAPRTEYLAAYNRVDIALDPFPYNGGTTTCDTLWMGVPLVTLAGHHFASRMSVSLLSNAGLPQLVAATVEEYVAIASALAHDPARLAETRLGLRARVRASPVMDAPRFTRHLEQAYRAMWQRWLAG